MNPNYPGYAPVSDIPYPTSYNLPPADNKWSQQSPTVVQATVAEPPPPLWYMISKYYVVITAGLSFGGLVLLAALVGLGALIALFTGSGGAFIALLFVCTLLSLAGLYFWKIPIQGALRDNMKYLIIHGVVTLVFLPGSFVTYAPIRRQGDDESSARAMAVYEALASPSVRYSSLLFGLAEILACFLMAHFIQKKAASQSISMA